MTDEVWRSAPGLPGYEVSDQGRARSLRSGSPRILAGGRDSRGYRQICVQTETGQATRLVHLLVAEAFLGPKPAAPEGTYRIEVCHRNGDRDNNAVSNLRYGTPKQNAADAIQHGTHTSVQQKARTHCKHGHKWTAANTAFSKTSKGAVVRRCRRCAVRLTTEYRARKRAAA